MTYQLLRQFKRGRSHSVSFKRGRLNGRDQYS